MNNTIKKISIAITLLLTFILTGCGPNLQTQKPANIAFIIGIADDEPQFNPTISEMKNLYLAPGTSYTIVACEGTPSIIGKPNTIVPDLSKEDYTESTLKAILDSMETKLLDRINKYKPKEQGIDIASAIELGVRGVRANSKEGFDNVLVFHASGKSTKGLINFIDTPIFQLDVEKSVSNLKNKMIDMSGIKVIWYCANDFGPRQAKPSLNEKATIKNFYKQVFLSLGAKSVVFIDNLPQTNGSYSFPYTPVPAMAVEGDSSGLNKVDILDNNLHNLNTPVVIPQDKVNFKGNSAEFVDRKLASNAIAPIANFLVKNPNLEIIIVGTTAGDDSTRNSLQLGKERAQRVKDEIVARGINPDRITAITLEAAHDPLHQYKLGFGDKAFVNRKAVIASRHSNYAKQVLPYAL